MGKKHLLKGWLTICFCTFFVFSGVGQQVLIIPDAAATIEAGNHALLFEDPTGALSFGEIQRKPFVRSQKEGLLFPFSNHVFWVKLRVKNKNPTQKEWILNWDNFLIENVQFYLQQEDGTFEIIKKGAEVPARKHIRSGPNISFTLEYDQERTVYMKVFSQRGSYSYLTLYSPEAFKEEQLSLFKKESFFNGLITLRLFYVILLALFVVKELAFRRYSILLVLRSLAYWGILGVLGSIFTDNSHAAIVINFLAYHLLPIGQILAVTAILPMHRFPAFVNYLFRGIMAVTLALAVAIVLDYQWYWLKASTYVVIMTQLFIFGLYIVSVVRKYSINWYYSVPFLLGIGSYIFIQMRLVGWVDFAWIYRFATICFISEVFIFGIFLSRIILNYEKAKNSSEQQLLFDREQALRLRELDRLKTNFFTNISHEFRTPLTLLVGPLAEFGKKYPHEGLIPAMQRNVRRLQTLINQLLDLSKLEAGKLGVEIQEGNLSTFLRRLFASFESLAQSQNIIFRYNPAPQKETAYFDADKVEKIVTNLLSNAFKFTPKNGRVQVEADIKNEELHLRVEDFGIGIAAERLPRIFDRFYQNEDTNGQHYEGTGIGLALVKELVEVHKGHIRVESTVGVGTVFTVILPVGREIWKDKLVDRPVELPEPEGKETLPLPPSADALIDEESDLPVLLIVEDNPDLRAYVRSIFESTCRILEASDGREGLAKAFEYTPDVVICDLMMPYLDGFGLCEGVKADTRTNHIPVIMLTAKASLTERLQGLEMGADDYLTKPFHREELEVRVRNLVKQRETLRQKYGLLLKAMPAKMTGEPGFSFDDRFLQHAQSVVEKHLGDSSFGVEQFCAEMNMSRTNFYRKLKALTGRSATEFIRVIRLQRAAQLLLQRAGSVSDIAYQVGFESLSYFSKSFQEQYEVTPSEFTTKKMDEI